MGGVFFAEGAYHIGNDRAFTLNLYSLDNKHDVYNIIPNRGFRVIQQENKWLAVNFEVSQVIPVTDSDGIRGFAGFQYALISKERSFLRMAGNQAAFRGLQSITGQNNGYFSGFGPRFGVDLKYNLPCDLISGMSVYTKAAVEVLVGATRSKLFIVSNPADAIRDIYNRTAETVVVPEFDIKAGFNYKQATTWGDFTLDIGWMFFDYISAIVERFDAESSDVSFEGAYLGLKWVGNFA